MKAAVGHMIKSLGGILPETALILGSGLGDLARGLEGEVRISYTELEGFPESGVSGHAGEFIAGYLNHVPVAILSGRTHYYENADARAMRPVLETLKEIGIKQLIATNSAGSLREEVPPGSVMMITDHINWSGANPLIGESSDERFVDMTNAYDKPMMDVFRNKAAASDMSLSEGSYMWFSGPSFETPAEIRAARILGADAVGMSTVPEIILARFLGLRCAAFSVITNFGGGMECTELTHSQTKNMAPVGGKLLSELITNSIAALSR
ncbi:MAG: purine-nucleoside phosphorylase [Rhizobiaceae bacterium]